MRRVLNSQGFGLASVLLIVGVTVAVGLAGLYVSKHQKKVTPTTKSSASSGTENRQGATTQPSQASETKPAWKEYCSKLEKACFSYPADWATGTFTLPDKDAEAFSVTSPDKAVTIYYTSHSEGSGGVCNPITDTVVMSEVTPLKNAAELGMRTALYKEENPNTTPSTTYKVILGVTDNLKAQEAGTRVSCTATPLFQSKKQTTSPGWSVGLANLKGLSFKTYPTQAEAEAAMASPDFQTAKDIVTSFKYQ